MIKMLSKCLLISSVLAVSSVSHASNDEYGFIYNQLGIYTPEAPDHSYQDHSYYEDVVYDPYGHINNLLGVERPDHYSYSSMPVSPEY